MLNTESQMPGFNADTTQLTSPFQSSTSKLIEVSGTQFATPPRPSSSLNLAILYPSFACNGLIS